jgi:mono/diheme cytochrome c family protein
MMWRCISPPLLLARPGNRASLIFPRFILPSLVLLAVGAARADEQVTFSKDVAPILQANCQECHHPGGIGPFSMMTYESTRPWAKAIQHATGQRVMPPWKAAPGYGEFRNERRLTDEQIRIISAWVDAGAPEGDPKDLPSARVFTDGWRLGTPDVVLDAGESFRVRATGGDFLREFVLTQSFPEDRWVTALEVLPGSPTVVHHVGIVVDPKAKSVVLDTKAAGPGYPGDNGLGFTPYTQIDFWTPGGQPRFLPEGTAWKLPANSRLVMEIHYSPDGQVHDDLTRVGLYFARGPVDKRVRFGVAGINTFTVPPGEKRYRLDITQKIPRDVTLLSVWPHMHWLGQEAKATATLPGGDLEPLVWVPKYDFHWQIVYVYKEPVKLPRNSRIDVEVYYDNSADNPRNPNRPPRKVSAGHRTRDEMCLFFYHYTVDAEHLTQGIAIENDGLEIRE